MDTGIVKSILKGTCAALLFLLSITSFSQTLKEKLQGDWLCTQIVNSKGEKAQGEFGESDDYLRFTFVHGHVLIAQAPFDKGLLMPVNFGLDSIDLLRESNWFLPELKYGVKSISPEELVLNYTNKRDEAIRYVFINQNINKIDLTANTTIREGGFIIFNRSEVVVSHVYGNKYNLVDYKIFNYGSSMLPSPIFGDERFSSFASYLSTFFKFPKTYHSSSTRDEIIIEFDVFKKGVKNIKIVKGLSYEMNAYLFLFIEKISKNWHPLRGVDGKVIPSKLRLHFIFFTEE